MRSSMDYQNAIIHDFPFMRFSRINVFLDLANMKAHNNSKSEVKDQRFD
jgi:hypothetical protein